MKNILIFFVLLTTILLGCKKENNVSSSSINGIQDSGMLVTFTYVDDKVSRANLTIPGSVNNASYADYEYSGDTDIKVSSSSSDITMEFFLNNSKLPVHMTRHETGTDGTQYNSQADFFYKPGTNILDSVNGYHLNTTKNYIHFTFEYDGENILKTIRNEGPLKDTFSYVYDVTPNLFHNSDPLLYVYANLLDELTPISSYYDYTFYSMIFFFPKVFSISTLNVFSYISGNTIVSGKLNYTLSNDNKILKEWYEGYRREYFYK